MSRGKMAGGICPCETGAFTWILALHLFLLPFRVFEID